MKIGVFVCHCGENIGRTVNCPEVSKACASFPGVVHSEDYKYMCSDPGQNLIKQAIREKKLDAVVVGSCSDLKSQKHALLSPVSFTRKIISICALILDRI